MVTKKEYKVKLMELLENKKHEILDKMDNRDKSHYNDHFNFYASLTDLGYITMLIEENKTTKDLVI